MRISPRQIVKKTDREGVAVNKNKIVALAQRYTLKGQFDKAIAEYRKLLKTDPSDIRTWLKIGDLYTRMGARKEATETYVRVAEQYTHSGFHLKAIAVYKQVLNIDPTMVVIHQYLAGSYLELGLTSEALIQLEQLADVYERTVRNDLLLEVLLQMGKIDSHNIATRLRIAELLSKENRVIEASKHFAQACEELKTQGRREDFIKVAERLLYHDPSRMDTALEVAALYIERGQYKEALGKLQVCFVKNRKNIDVLDLLAKAFLGLGQPEKAVSVMTEMADVLAGEGYEVRRKEVFEEILSIDPENDNALAGLGKKSPAGPEPGGQSLNHAVLGDDVDIIAENSSSGIDLLADLTAAESMTDDNVAGQSQELIKEATVLLKYGLKERALEHLHKVFDIDPYNIDGRETARDILLSLDRRNEALEHLFLLAEVFKVAQPEGAIYYLHEVLKVDRTNERAKQMIRDLGGIMPEGMEDAASLEVDEEPTLLEDDEDILIIDDDDLQQADAVILETEELDSDLDEWDLSSEPPPPQLRQPSEFPAAKETPLSPAAQRDNTVVEVVDYIDDPLDFEDDLPDMDDTITISDDDDIQGEVEIEEELDPLTLTDPLCGPVTSEFTESINEGADYPAPVLSAPKKPTSPPEPKPKTIAPEEPATIPEINDDLDEIEFFLDQELFEEAAAAISELVAKYSDDPRVRTLAARLDSERPPKADDSENPDKSVVSAKAAPITVPSISEKSEGSVQFKNVGVKEKLSDSDSVTSWDLGLAYKEMGLFEDAIHAFEIVSRDPSKAAPAKMMIGICQTSLDRMDDAVLTFNEGLLVTDLDANKKMGLLYELGKTFQLMGQTDDARQCYEHIQEIDSDFADVASRMRSLIGAKKSAARR